MKIGYPCINNSIGCTCSGTFRLKNFSQERFVSKVENNLDCLRKILDYNLTNKILFFRISSDLIPFASHIVCQYNWQKMFKEEFQEIGDFIKKNNMRISMHPDQFTLINSLDPSIFQKSLEELNYHCRVLDAMRLDDQAKVQIHIGGVYNDKKNSLKRFVKRYKSLPAVIRKRLVVENDHRSYTLSDCLEINSQVSIPVLFDVFHHQINSSGESLIDALNKASSTWSLHDGVAMIDYSSQKLNARPGMHAESINLDLFKEFLKEGKGLDFDIMLEIKDKEKSAIKAIALVSNDPRFTDR